MIKFLLLVLLFSFNIRADVKVRYLNGRFMWVEADSKYVKVHLDKPTAGMSLYSIDIKTPKEKFSFVVRRAWPYRICVDDVVELRQFLKKNMKVIVMGNMGSKERVGSYYSMWELIKGSSGCIGYFGGCEDYEKDNSEIIEYWKANSIDPNRYP